MIQLLRKCLYIFQLKVIPQSVKNLVLCGYWNHIKFQLELSGLVYRIRLRTSASASDIGTCRAGRLGGLVAIVGQVSGPPEMRVMKLVYMKGLVSEKVRPYGVYSTFGSSTSKYLLRTPRPKSARVFRGKLHA